MIGAKSFWALSVFLLYSLRKSAGLDVDAFIKALPMLLAMESLRLGNATMVDFGLLEKALKCDDDSKCPFDFDELTGGGKHGE